MIRNSVKVLLVLLATTDLVVGQTGAKLRNVDVGDKMPAFTLGVLGGGTYSYPADANQVEVFVFVEANQPASEHVVADTERIITEWRQQGQSVECRAITSDVGQKEYFETLRIKTKMREAVLLDGEFHLWGLLGVIAMPTVVITGKDGTIAWVTAGYGYDFAALMRAHLAVALGVGDEKQVARAEEVRSLSNSGVGERVDRYLKMARMLEEKGRYESALTELRKAQDLQPGTNEVLLGMGQLYCRLGRNDEAVQTAGQVKSDKKSDLALAKLINGWAARQMGNFGVAAEALQEAVKLDPKSARAWFELGKTYEKQGENQKALEAYRQALGVVFHEVGAGANSHN
jgi:Flp pilus assembly protein TadD